MPAHSVLRKLPVLYLALALAACSGPATDSTDTPAPATTSATSAATATSAAPKGGDLIIGMGYEPAHLDPHAGNSYDQQYMHLNLFDPLVWRAPDGSFVPGLAASWDISADGKTFTFHLRDDVTFHDGTPFNAEAVKFSFDRLMAPDFPSFTSRGLMGPYAGSQVLDDDTLQVNFSEPYRPFLDALSQWWLVPVSPAAVEKAGADFGQHPVGTGPFMFGERVDQDHVTLVRNPDYNWAPGFFEHQGPPYLNSVTFKFIPEPANRAGTLESGEILVAQDVAPVDIQRLQSRADLQLYRVPLPGQPTLLFMNTECGATADLAVRQALEWGTAKQQLIDTLWGGLYEPAYGPLTPGLLGYDPAVESVYGYDPDKARQILEDAGWVDADGDGIREKDSQPLTLAFNTMAFNRYPEVLQLPVAAWKDLGLDAQLTVMTWPEFSSAGWACDASLMPYFTPASDPYFVTTAYFRSSNVDSGFAFSRLRDAHLDALLDTGATAADDAARQAAYAEATRLIMQQAGVLPLYVSYNLTMASQAVHGLQFSAQGWYALLYDVSVAP